MVICFVALGVFSIMGIFSLRYRRLAAEAFDCVFRQMTFRPCLSRLDERIKARLVSRMLPRSPGLARLLNRYFKAISWFFVILMFVSLFFAGKGFYNYVRYGNCNGPNSNAFCIFNLTSAVPPEKCPSNCTPGTKECPAVPLSRPGAT